MSKNHLTESDLLPGRFSVWLGVVAGALTGGLLFLAGERGLFPAGWWGTAGRWMCLVHALACFAIVCLLGQRVRQGQWSATLRDYERPGRDFPDAPDWVKRAFAKSVTLLRQRPSHDERRGSIENVRSMMELDLARRWQIPRDLAFVMPVVGCLLSLLNLRLVSNSVPWSEVGMPLVVAIAESTAVILLTTWVARDARSILNRWKLVAEELSASRRTDANQALDEPVAPEVEEIPDQWDDEPEAEQPPFVPVPDPVIETKPRPDPEKPGQRRQAPDPPEPSKPGSSPKPPEDRKRRGEVYR